MTLWPLLVIAAVGILLGILLAAGSRLFRGTRRVDVPACWCPLRMRAFDVQFEVTAWEGVRTDVTRCSAFDPPVDVTCPKACMHGAAPIDRERIAV